MTKPETSDQRMLILAFFISLLFQSLLAWSFPLTQDEAYYFYWARFPDFGYFDHPPMIAWLAGIGPKLGFGDSVFSFRLGGLLAATAFFPLSISLFRQLNLDRTASLLTATILLHFNLAGLIFGFINTPDLPLTLFWLLALHEALAALKGQSYRWITAGLATGLGIQSKYSMVLIGLVFFYGLWRSRGGLRSLWPYMGGVACVLILSPHLWWNAQHDWISVRFQLGRGFLSQYDVATQLAASLPKPTVAQPSSREVQLANYFKLPELLEKPRQPRSQWERKLSRIGEFIGGQIGLWGLLAPVMAWQYFRWRRNQLRIKIKPKQLAAHHLMIGAATIPLIVFGLISPFQNIEANWPAIYMIGAAAWLGSRPWIHWPALMLAASFNMALIALLLWHSHAPFDVTKPAKDRILRETHGYQQLAEYLAGIEGPLFADTYQSVSMLAFYQPEKQFNQWPNISRISELVRRPEMVHYQWQDLVDQGRFHLLIEQLVPPKIPDFQAENLWQLIDCIDGTFAVRQAQLSGSELPDCKSYVHRWTLVEYTRNKEDPAASKSVDSGS